jgi:probable rRNA maturation factor
MRIAVAVSLDRVRVPLSQERVAEVTRAVLRAEKVRDALVSITFVSNAAMTRLNKAHLRRNRPTDVIAFGFRRVARNAPVIGDIYIAPAVARDSAAANGITMREEIVRLVVHGTLHVLGYDHPESDDRVSSRMWRKQERLVTRLQRQS